MDKFFNLRTRFNTSGVQNLQAVFGLRRSMEEHEVIDLCSPSSGGPDRCTQATACRRRRISIPSFYLAGSDSDTGDESNESQSIRTRYATAMNCKPSERGVQLAGQVDIGASGLQNAGKSAGMCARGTEKCPAMSFRTLGTCSLGVQQRTRKLVLPSFDLAGSSTDSCDGSGDEQQARHRHTTANRDTAAQATKAVDMTLGSFPGEPQKPDDWPVHSSGLGRQDSIHIPVRHYAQPPHVPDADGSKSNTLPCSRKSSGGVMGVRAGGEERHEVSNDLLSSNQSSGNAERKKWLAALKWSNMWSAPGNACGRSATRKRGNWDVAGKQHESRRKACAGAHSVSTTKAMRGRLGAVIDQVDAAETQGLTWRGPARRAADDVDGKAEPSYLREIELGLWGAKCKQTVSGGKSRCRGGGKIVGRKGKSNVMTVMAKDVR